MLVLLVTYVTLALGALVALSLMILKIGTLLGECPNQNPAAKAAAVAIATGFAAIGAGGVILIGATVPVLADRPYLGLMLSLGLAALCLGLGFSNAVAVLRTVLAETSDDPVPAVPVAGAA